MFNIFKKKKESIKDIELKNRLELVIVKLITGEELIAKIIMKGNTPFKVYDCYRFIHPFVIWSDYNDEDEIDISLNNWIPYSCSTIYDININHIMTITIPNNNLITLYDDYLHNTNSGDNSNDNLNNEYNPDISNALKKIVTAPFWIIKRQ